MPRPKRQCAGGIVYHVLNRANTYSDQFAGETKEIYDNHMNLWHQFVLNSGCTEDEWEMWMKHQDEHDYHATAIDQIAWLKKAGFSSIDITWRYLLWTVLTARKLC